MRAETMLLPVELRPDELQSRGQRLADDWARLDNEEADLKARFKREMEALKEKRLELTHLRTVVSQGKESRPVPVYRVADVAASCWRVYREDTGEFVTTEEMTASEFRDSVQPSLFGGAKEWKAEKAEAVELSPPVDAEDVPGTVADAPEENARVESDLLEERLKLAVEAAEGRGVTDEEIEDIFSELGGLPWDIHSIPEGNRPVFFDRVASLKRASRKRKPKAA